jgi:membrane protein implicated in regulation of membrane protease activity
MKNFSKSLSKFKESLNTVAQYNYGIGKQRYILVHGIAIYGGAMFIVWQIVAFCVDSVHLSGRWLVYWLTVSIFVNACIGLLVGWIQWRWSERRVSRILPEQ